MTYVSAGFAVMSSFGDGVERLLTLHAQRDLFLPDRSGRSLSELCAILTVRKKKILESPQKHLDP